MPAAVHADGQQTPVLFPRFATICSFRVRLSSLQTYSALSLASNIFFFFFRLLPTSGAVQTYVTACSSTITPLIMQQNEMK